MGLNAEIHQNVVCHVQVLYVFNEECEWRQECEGADLSPGITIRPWMRPCPLQKKQSVTWRASPSVISCSHESLLISLVQGRLHVNSLQQRNFVILMHLNRTKDCHLGFWGWQVGGGTVLSLQKNTPRKIVGVR
jgi:hypothetical protein